MLTPVALAAYRSAGVLGSPVLRRLTRRRARLGKEDPLRLNERYGEAGFPRGPGPLCWFHAASVGESLSVLPLIQRIHREFPETAQLLTTTTLTSAQLISKKLPPPAVHQFAPFDTPLWTRRFLRHWRPNIGVIVESEIWPNILTQAKADGTALVLVNGRVSKRAATAWLRAPALAKHIFGLFDKVFAQSPDDEIRLRRLGVHDASYRGNLRFSAPRLSADVVTLECERKRFKGRRIWLAASTHQGEEEIIGHAHKRLSLQCPGLLTIIAPRHPSRAPAITERLTKLSLHVARRSLDQPVTRETDIYLADTLGELGVWFRLVSIVLMGGSLVPAGGHNPIEAARLDCAILCGPHMENQTVPTERLRAASALFVVDSEAAIAKTVFKLQSDDGLRESTIAAAAQCAEAEAGALDRIFDDLRPMLVRALTKDFPEVATP